MSDPLDELIAAALGGSSGGGGSSGETFGPIRYEPSIGKYVQDGSRGTIRVVGGPVSQEPARDPSGFDPSSGLPYGVTRVSTTVSPTGLVYQGVPVNPDGSRYAGSTSQVANYTGIKEGPGGLWGLNTNTGTYEKIPGSETLGKAASSGPATYSGGGGYQIPRDHVGEAKAKGDAGVAVAQAEGAARSAVAQAEAQAAMMRDAAQYGFTSEQNALSRAFQAAQQAWQGNVTNLQLQQQDEAAKRAAANDFRSAVSDTDPIAFAALMKGWGNMENAIRGGDTAVTDRALGGAAGLLDLIRRPFNPIPGFTWNEPTGSFVPNATGGATVPGLTTGGTAGGGVVGTAMPGPGEAAGGATAAGYMSPQNDAFMRLQQLHSVGYEEPPTPEQIALFWNIAQGRGQDPLVTGNYSGMWQSVDPYAPNWRPPYEGYNLPGQTFNWATNQNEPTQATTNPYNPVNTPLTVPGLARGGMAKGAFIVGDSPSGKPTGHEEMVIAPQGAHVIPLDKPQAKRMLNGGLRGYASGTGWYSNTVTAEQQAAADAQWAAMNQAQSEPVYDYQQPTYTPIQQPTYAAPQPTYTQPTTTGGSGTTTVAAPSSPVPSSASVSSTTAPPAVNTTNTAAVPTAPTPTTTNATPAAPVPTTIDGLVNYGGQQITPDYQALLDEIRNFRTDPTQNTYDRTLNPYDVSFNNLDPISQEVFYRGRQAEFGLPVVAQQWEQNRFRLPGLSRGQIGIGY